MKITKLKIESNPFAKGFRDNHRLSDLERESIEQMIKDNNGVEPTINPAGLSTTPSTTSYSQNNSDYQNNLNSLSSFGKFLFFFSKQNFFSCCY